ncbi:hypothetical protein PVL30_002914 [Lodderomyces elongisporus]|uniref:uncharacterized protein n=1 Tax=Lodderomyces elongisporus TaxID=36914 RepID=UPI002924DBED|nr:uncharacterized protein PVL30_002914 [Lodderomyces elongisporus]WLF79163.1 hypothetical protein PVL30_002914 [Lodderomyces elongisporus]
MSKAIQTERNTSADAPRASVALTNNNNKLVGAGHGQGHGHGHVLGASADEDWSVISSSSDFDDDRSTTSSTAQYLLINDTGSYGSDVDNSTAFKIPKIIDGVNYANSKESEEKSKVRGGNGGSGGAVGSSSVGNSNHESSSISPSTASSNLNSDSVISEESTPSADVGSKIKFFENLNHFNASMMKKSSDFYTNYAKAKVEQLNQYISEQSSFHDKEKNGRPAQRNSVGTEDLEDTIELDSKNRLSLSNASDKDYKTGTPNIATNTTLGINDNGIGNGKDDNDDNGKDDNDDNDSDQLIQFLLDNPHYADNFGKQDEARDREKMLKKEELTRTRKQQQTKNKRFANNEYFRTPYLSFLSICLVIICLTFAASGLTYYYIQCFSAKKPLSTFDKLVDLFDSIIYENNIDNTNCKGFWTFGNKKVKVNKFVKHTNALKSALESALSQNINNHELVKSLNKRYKFITASVAKAWNEGKVYALSVDHVLKFWSINPHLGFAKAASKVTKAVTGNFTKARIVSHEWMKMGAKNIQTLAYITKVQTKNIQDFVDSSLFPKATALSKAAFNVLKDQKDPAKRWLKIASLASAKLSKAVVVKSNAAYNSISTIYATQVPRIKAGVRLSSIKIYKHVPEIKSALSQLITPFWRQQTTTSDIIVRQMPS